MNKICALTSRKTDIINLTGEVNGAVSKSGVNKGRCLVFVHHATAPVLLTGADWAVEHDVLISLPHMVPNQAVCAHQHGAQEHGASQLKSSLFSHSEAIPFKNSALKPGTWHSIAFYEINCLRNERKVIVQGVCT